MDSLYLGLVAAIASLIAGAIIIYTERWHASFSFDDNLTTAQKFHKRPVPRIGGIAILCGILAAIIYGGLLPSQSNTTNDTYIISLVIAALPTLAAGFIEDITKNVRVITRLLATFSSAVIASWLIGATLPRLDFWGIDALMKVIPAIAIIITAFSVAGVANSVNIIDGFNGLAGSTVIVLLAGIGFIAWSADDMLVAELAICMIGATIGFMIYNFPTGRMFMGDGGAYLLGFWVAEVAVLTIVRNPEVNAWQILAICAYPIIEVLYSIYRKKIVRNMSPGLPDRLHFHMLVYRRFVCRIVPCDSARPWIRNSMVACVATLILIPLTFLSVRFGKTIAGALMMITIQVLLYLALYARLVRGHWCLNPAVVFGLRSEHRPSVAAEK